MRSEELRDKPLNYCLLPLAYCLIYHISLFFANPGRKKFLKFFSPSLA